MFLQGRGPCGEITPEEFHDFVGDITSKRQELEIRGRGSKWKVRIRTIGAEDDNYRVVAMRMEEFPIGRIRSSKFGKALLGASYTNMDLVVDNLKDPDRNLTFSLHPADPNGRLRVAEGNREEAELLRFREPTPRDTADVNYSLVGFAFDKLLEVQ